MLRKKNSWKQSATYDKDLQHMTTYDICLNPEMLDASN